MTATSTDPQSGIQKINFPTLGAGFSGGGDDSSSPYSSSYTWSSSADSGSKTVTATNGIGTTATSTFSLVRDTTAPAAGGVLSVNGTTASGVGTTSTTTSTAFTIGTRTDYTEAQNTSQAGLATSALTVQSETFDGATCGTPGSGGPFSSPTTISGTTQPGGIQAGFCYLYTLTGTDNVGNATNVKTTVIVGLNYTFVVSNPGTRIAGTAFGGITIQLQLNGSNTTSFYGAAYTGAKTIGFSGPGNAPDTTAPTYPSTVTFTNGLATLPASSITLFKAETTTLTATQNTTVAVTGASTSFTVNPAAATAMKLANCVVQGNSQACNGSYMLGNGGAMTAFVDIFDAYGNVPAATIASITITSASPTNYTVTGSPVAITGSGSPINRSSTQFTIQKNGNANNSTTITLHVTTAGLSIPDVTFTVQK